MNFARDKNYLYFCKVKIYYLIVSYIFMWCSVFMFAIFIYLFKNS